MMGCVSGNDAPRVAPFSNGSTEDTTHGFIYRIRALPSKNGMGECGAS
jgi:hypothetical protein